MEDSPKPRQEQGPDPKPDQSQTQKQDQKPAAALATNGLRQQLLAGVDSAFSALYALMLLMMAIAFSAVCWLAYALSTTAVEAIQGGKYGEDSYTSTPLAILWAVTVLVVTLPLGAALFYHLKKVLASRFENVLPTKGLRGLQTFLLLVAGLGAVVSLAAAIYAPVSTLAPGNTSPINEALVGTTAPALVGVLLSLAFVFLVTRSARELGHAKLLLWTVTLLAAGLAAGGYFWSTHLPTRKPPVTPGTSDYSPYIDDSTDSTDSSFYEQ